jgi:hypothetical protein
MLWRTPHNPNPYDDDWEDQPGHSGFHQYGLGVMLPVVIAIHAISVFAAGQAVVGGRVTMTLRDSNALAYALAAASLSVFLHCHYYWGNVYNQAWPAVLGKIFSAGVFITALAFLIVRIGIFGRG